MWRLSLADLQILAAEAAKKKFPAVKESADRAIAKAKILESEVRAEASEGQVLARGGDELVRTFLLACETKNQRIVAVAVHSLQKMVAQGAIPRAQISALINVKDNVLELNDEASQLKLLQAMVGLLTTTYDLHGEQLAAALSVCFRLYESRVPSVVTTASASLRQIISLLFEKARTEQQGLIPSASAETAASAPPAADAAPAAPPSSSAAPSAAAAVSAPPSGAVSPRPRVVTLPPFQADARSILQDVCLLAGGEPALWLPLAKLPRNLGLELIEIILNAHPQLFLGPPNEFSLLLKDYVCPLVVKSFKLKAEFPLILRLNRIMLVFIRHFTHVLVPESEVFLSRLVRVLETDTQPAVFMHYDHVATSESARIFSHIASSVGRFIQRMFDWDNDLVVSSGAASKLMARPISDMLGQAEPPTSVHATYIIALAVECLVGIADGVAKMSAETDAPGYSRNIYIKMAESSWPSLLAALAMLFAKSHDEVFAQNILKTYQSFTFCCGSLGLRVPRDALLTQLIKFAIPSREPPPPPDPHALPNTEPLLSTKNFQSVKTLLNIATCMGGVLEDSWGLIFDALDQLDRIVATPGANIVPADQVFVVSALGNVPKSAKFLDDQAVSHMLQALVRLTHAQLLLSPARVFGLQKLVETVSVTSDRVQLVWTIVSEQLLAACEHRRDQVRGLAVDCLTQMIVTFCALTAAPAAKDQQNKLLEALERLYSSTHLENRSKAHNALYQMLQSSGQFLRSWSLILSMLMTVVVNNDKALIPISFKSVEFITSEFLSALPIGCTALLVTTLSHYGQQTVDINISLTAISLLWNIVDFLSRESTSRSVSSKADAEPGGGRNSPEGHMSKLWLSVFTEMKTLCLDPRPETRNCALVTLFKAIGTHGVALPADIWALLFREILFPLLVETYAGTERANAEESAAELGKEGGKSVKMMVHHSRSTEKKQWHESQVNLVSGVARIMRTYYPTLSHLPKFDDYWTEVLTHVVLYCQSPSKEVATAAILGLKEMLQAQPPTASPFLRAPWDASWNAVESAVKAATKPDKELAASKALSLFVGMVADLCPVYRPVLPLSDMKRIFRITEMLGVYAEKHASPPTPIHEALIKFHRELPLSDEIQPLIISQLLLYISIAISLDRATADSAALPPPSSAPAPFSASLDKLHLAVSNPAASYLAERSIGLIVLRFAQFSPAMKTLLLGPVIKVFGATMQVKFVSYPSLLWPAAAKALAELISTTLSPAHPDHVWLDAVDVVECFVLHDRSGLPPMNQEGLRADEQLEATLLDSLAKQTLLRAAKVQSVQERHLRLLRTASTLAAAGREGVAQAAVTSLFEACNAPAQPVARFVLSTVLGRTREVLSAYVTDERHSGSMPLPQYRAEEVYLLLQQLSSLSVAPEVLDPAPRLSVGRHGHLLVLFPLLCDCVTTRDVRMRELLRDILHKVSADLGLE